jgi:hypothetical protein
MDAAALRERTLARNDSLWVNWDTGGVAAGLVGLENLINRVSQDIVRYDLAIQDGEASFQAAQRDKLHNLEMEEVETNQLIARAKYEAKMQVLALKVAGEEALLAAKRYDVLVQARIMLAKEYAAQVEREQIALQRDRAKMDIKKEEAHLAEVQSRIMLEYFERAQVEVDIAKAQLQVAQANVRAVMAEIAAEEAMLKAVQAELEVAMVDAERATLIADIASIFADIVVRGLAKIKLAVETAEIEAGFGFIQQKLDDLLAIWDDKITVEEVRAQYEALLKTEVDKQTQESIVLEDLKKTQMKADVEVFFFEKDKVDGADTIPEMRAGGRSYEDQQILHDVLDEVREKGRFEGIGQSITDCEVVRQDNLFEEKKIYTELKHDSEAQLDKVRKWAEVLINKAHAKVSQYREIFDYEIRNFSQKIHKGFFATQFPGAGPAPSAEPPEVDLSDKKVSKEECDQDQYVGPEDR